MEGWGYEDEEIFIRLLKLGYSVLRTPGIGYHIEHTQDLHYRNHPKFNDNLREYNRIATLNPDTLRREIKTWEWVQSAPLPA